MGGPLQGEGNRGIKETEVPDPSRVQVIIPALDEEATIGEVIGSLRKEGFQRVRVVDNGSRDATAQVAADAGAEVVREDRRGYGQACWTGTRDLPADVEWLLFCDADGSDDISEAKDLLEAAGSVEYVQGDRSARAENHANLTPVQRFGNWLATRLLWLGWGARFRDMGPFRLIRRTAFEKLKMEDRGFGWTIEMQARVADAGLPFRELPVTYRPRQGGKSKIAGTIRGSAQAGVIILSTLGMMWLRKPWVQWAGKGVASVLVLAGAALMMPFGDLHQPSNVPVFMLAAMIMGLGFAVALALRDVSLWLFWGVAVAARCLLLFMHPGDDIWRYMWEGMVQGHGFSPYIFPPDHASLEALRPEWWGMINHPEVAAVYPPLTQLLFLLMAAISSSVLLFKVVFIAADLMICRLLAREFGRDATLVYAWNPLVLYCVAGGGHFDSIFMLLMVWGWLNFEKGRPMAAAVWIGCSMAVKWMTLPLLGWMVWRMFIKHGFGKAVTMLGVGVAPVGIGLLAYGLIHGSWVFFPTEFVSVARSAELLPWFVDTIAGNLSLRNSFYVMVAGVATAALILVARPFRVFAEIYFFVLLVVSPALHGWYYCWLVPLAVATRQAGTILVSVSGFTYFWLLYRMETEGNWDQTLFEKALLWSPFVAGFLLSYVRARCLRQVKENVPEDAKAVVSHIAAVLPKRRS